MNRPDLKAVTISPNPADARAAIAVTLDIEDKEIVFSSSYNYAKSPNSEIYAGEDGLI